MSTAAPPTPRVFSLPPFPAIARQLIALLSQERSNLEDMSRLIRSDAVFTAEVLRLANSALLGLRYEVVSILHAVSVLGMDRLKGLVLTVALRDLFRPVAHSELVKRCWRHNLACALVAEWSAEACWQERSFAYTAGLLHSLGHLALVTLDPALYDEALAAASDGAPLPEEERDRFGMDHVEAAAALVAEWGLPEPFGALSNCHEGAFENPETLRGLIVLACDTSARLGFSLTAEPPPWDPSCFLQRLPEPSRARLAPRMQELTETVPYKINAFEVEFLH